MPAEYNKVMDIRQHGEKPEITLRDASALTVASVQSRTKDSYQYNMHQMLGLTKVFHGHWSLDPDRPLSPWTGGDVDHLRMARRAEGMTANTTKVELRFLKRVNNFCKKKNKVNPDLDTEFDRGLVKCQVFSETKENAIPQFPNAKASEGNAAYQKAADLFDYLKNKGLRLIEAILVE